MSDKLELIKVETDTAKVYSPSDSFVFKLTFSNQSYISEDVEFEITYFGDAYSEDHDQRICHNVIGPLDAGKLYFELETSPIDLTKIPIKTLFGLTTILIVGKFRGEQFIRIGYVVNVRYPGIDADKLLDGDSAPANDQEDVEEGETSEEDVEIMDDEELDGESCSNKEENCDGEDGSDDEPCCSKDECSCDKEDSCDDEPCCSKDECSCNKEECSDSIKDTFEAALLSKNNRKPIPLETPILADKDEFEYKGIPMKQSKIELTLLEKPIVHVFDIDWGHCGSKDDEEVVASSENEENRSEVQEPKKPRTQ